MFDVQEIGRISEEASRDAILVPLNDYPWKFTEQGVQTIVETADGYPNFIQFICRQACDWKIVNPENISIPMEPIVHQLDSNFFGGRWEMLTDRQRDLLYCIAKCPTADDEFTVSEIVAASKSPNSKEVVKPFVAGDVSQVLPRLIEKGLIYKNRHGKYSFAVPLFSRFIDRTFERRHQITNIQKRLFDG
jgi:hypothetical protein